MDWFEALSENYMEAGGRPRRVLDEVRSHRPVVLHGVAMNLGSTDALDESYLARLAELAARVEPAWVSDHLCWTGVGGRNLHDLLPLPYTEEAVERVASRIRAVQDRLGRRIAIENVSSYATFRADGMTEWEFLCSVAEQGDCHILLDVNNVFVSAHNHGFDPEAYLDAIPAGRVIQIHLAGHSEHGPLLIDTHDHPIRDEVWKLFERVVARLGRVSTLIEWDDRLPGYDDLEREAARAKEILDRAAPPDLGRGEPRRAGSAPPVRPGCQRSVGLLSEAQGRLRSWITAPGGVGELKDDFAALLAGDVRADAAARLEIYANAYFFRIHDALCEDHGALRACLGETLFHDLVTAYLLVHPPSHPSLRHAGDHLPDYLARAASAEPFRRACPWAADLAALERACLDAFDAADAAPLPRAALERIAPERWASLRLRFVPALRQLALDWPVRGVLRAHKADTPLPSLEPARGHVCVWRVAERVRHRELLDEEARCLARARAGTRFGELCEELALHIGAEQAPARAAAWLARWQTDGLLAAADAD